MREGKKGYREFMEGENERRERERVERHSERERWGERDIYIERNREREENRYRKKRGRIKTERVYYSLRRVFGL